MLLSEILRSELFDEYRAGHALLGNANVDSGMALATIARTSETLLAANKSVLKHGRVVAALVDLTVAAVSTVSAIGAAFGGFGGSVLKDWLERRKRVIVYDLSGPRCELTGLSWLPRDRSSA